jgi:hypothetical protein
LVIYSNDIQVNNEQSYPPRPSNVSDTSTPKHDEEFNNNFQIYPTKPEADRSLSNLSLDDEFKSVTPIKVDSKINHKIRNPRLNNYEPQNRDTNIIKSPGIEIINNRKKKTMRAEEVKIQINNLNDNEVDFKREGSLAPERNNPNRIWTNDNPSDDYSPIKQNMLRSDRKNGRNNKAAHSTQHRVTFSAEKEPAKTRVGGQKHTEHEERKLSLNPAHLSILKKSGKPLYLGREAKPNLKTKDFNKIKPESALLKTDFESGSSNPSSRFTGQTGKRSVNERNKRRLGESQYSGACKLTLNFKIFSIISKEIKRKEYERCAQKRYS